MKQISFFHRIFIVMSTVTLFIVFAFEYLLYENINSVRVESMESLALTQSRLIASNRNLQYALSEEDGAGIKRLMKNYNIPPNIDYVSVSTPEMVRLYHSEGRGIGKKLVEADIESIGAGNDVTSISTGIEGKLLIKARVPVYYNNEFVGIISTGLNYDEVLSKVSDRFHLTLLLSFAILFGLFFFNQSFTGYIRRKMQGQSPQQIEMALKLRQGILNSVYEGVIAVDSKNEIMVINDSALKALHFADEREQVHGSHIADYLYPTDFFESANDKEVTDQLVTCNGETLLANRSFMLDDRGNKTGAVISFRIRREKEELEQTINAVIQDKENLRAIIHEFNNQMAIIYGLLQMERYEKAMDFIQSEHKSKQSDIYTVSKAFNIPTLVALVLSKISRAKELGVILEIDPMSSIQNDQLPITENKLTCIVGNLINNAFEAIVRSDSNERRVRLHIHQGKDLIIEVEDSGDGIKDADVDKIFKRGYTNKSEPNHGVGLSLIDTIVTQAGGTIIVEESELGGALFNIYIPDSGAI
ncbi:sensor histidine kinase [Vibrio sp. JC009]|uniref:ATP-binding protein n=1 Tax=Vibrio sp. JC009 TaxID=2912314 RepID=UPI0023B1733B|nr:sensor histidine kinase [Vibrio sp. JC009]WED23897.1 sensor histidine kinase [Vibrio sp. JC009]